jgi:ABC-type transport system involved in multi-copper enzyme maturation permease subunit
MFADITSGDVAAWSALGLLGLIGVVVAGVLLVGLFNARSLIRRELAAYFYSPVAYVVLVVFLAVTGWLFRITLGKLTDPGPDGVAYPMQLMLGDWTFWLVFLFIPPLLTMRLFAEERGTGTLEVLMTSPLRDWQVVLSKYLACFAFYVLLWVPTLVYLPVLLNLDVPLNWSAWTGYVTMLVAGLGTLLLGVLLAVPPLGKPVRFIAIGLIVVGSAVAATGAVQHFTSDPAQVLTLNWAAWTLNTTILVVGLVALLVGLALTSRGLGTTARVVALLLVVAGVIGVAGGGWLHYHADPTQVLVIPAHIDPAPVVASYLGVLLAGAMFLAIGLLVSSLVRSQMVAALVSLVLSLGFIAAGFLPLQANSSNPVSRLVFFFTVPLHFRDDFSRGIVDTRHLVLYVSVAVFCLFLTVRSLEARRWQ